MITKNNAVPFYPAGDGIKRKILQCGKDLMMVENHFEKGAVGPSHNHEHHEQVGYIQSGEFEVTCGDATSILLPGDSFYAAKGENHGVTALKAGVLLDIFTPIRADFLE